jgi:regulator of replication initiation timing
VAKGRTPKSLKQSTSMRIETEILDEMRDVVKEFKLNQSELITEALRLTLNDVKLRQKLIAETAKKFE